MRKLAALATLLLALTACGGGENDGRTPTGVTVTDPEGDVCTVDTTPDGAGFDCPNGERFTQVPEPQESDNEWKVGDTRIVEYESWWGEGTGEIAQIEVRLLGVDTKRERCSGPGTRSRSG